MGDAITFSANGRTSGGYLARAGESTPRGIVVIQEWWGVDDHIQSVADRFAAAGYTALAPDLYHGTVVPVSEPNEAGKQLMAMNIDVAAKDIRGGINHVRSLTGSPVGIIGFCMGGGLSLFAACENGDSVAACIDFYGGSRPIKPDLTKLTAPVLGIFGGRDASVPPQEVAELDRRLNELGKAHEFTTYPEAGHAFFNDTRPEVYDPAASRDAWSKVLTFLGRHLT